MDLYLSLVCESKIQKSIEAVIESTLNVGLCIVHSQ